MEIDLSFLPPERQAYWQERLEQAQVKREQIIRSMGYLTLEEIKNSKEEQ